ncbi:hypothetical protein BU15DRAFT_87440 [Melanogaster broomeanus]|nr:hypothetical protein BU15DRAFT_87440 [Melanogaster broomeanus]
MPKAPPSASTASRPALRRNQACRSCRKRKLKCDAARPHCGTCVKQWQSIISVPAPPGYAAVYDPVDGLALAPDTDPIEKIRTLEEEVCKRRNSNLQLQERNNTLSPPRHSQAFYRPGSASSSPGASSDAALELIYSGWNPDLPEPHILDHYIEVFFKCDPCGPRILHRPSFLSAMRLHPRDPAFPHSAILHAICASASRWSSRSVAVLPDGSREDIFAVVQACILLSWYFYQEGRWVEIWVFAGFQTRIAVPLRLNYPGTFSTHGSYLIRGEDFDTEQLIPSNPQDMSTEDIFTTHLPRYTDSFLLLIKAVMMFGRVTDFNVRGNLRAPTAPSKHQDPFALSGFSELDNLAHRAFLENLPHMYRSNIGVTDVSGSAQCVDTDLYMVHIIPHAATITLHNPYMDLNDLQRTSTNRCIKAAQAILSAYFMLSATSLDITRLHPFVTICWYLAAAVQVQVCKYLIEIGDHVRKAQVWEEINVLREAMLSYGTRSPIGTRQEKLLQGLMEEIVRLTNQKRSLEVGVPLYPFSHTRLFASPTVTPNAPLPYPSTASRADARDQEHDPLPPHTLYSRGLRTTYTLVLLELNMIARHGAIHIS